MMRKTELFFPVPVLETARTRMKEMTLQDAEDMFEYASDEEISRFATWPAHQTIADSQRFLNWIIQRYSRGEIAPWGIYCKQSERLIGTCGFGNWNQQHARAEIGYALSRSCWGHGLMTEVVNKVIRYGFTSMKLVRIEARCYPDNTASIRVLEKCGFQQEGVLRKHIFAKGRYEDVHLFSIINEDLLDGQQA
ncbi:GNAT family N-acetyltransferase [Paenibacillus alvei]|uniref:GNAT family N-acetyltransferase n=1 Tax=Paenibacillus alvei TaxID=44250 RepID=UPI000414B1F4|nr:GNAT family protein [Paenibacillus alvei]